MSTPQQELLFPNPDPGTRWLTPICAICQDGDLVSVWIAGAPLFRFSADSQADRRLAAALIAEANAAPVKLILKEFHLDDATLWRDRQRLKEGGAVGLLLVKRGPKGPTKLGDPLVRRVAQMVDRGLLKKTIARRLRISDFTLRRALKKAGVAAAEPVDGTQLLPLESGAEGGALSESEPSTEAGVDGDCVAQLPTLENKASAESAVAADSVPESSDAEASVETMVAAKVGVDVTQRLLLESGAEGGALSPSTEAGVDDERAAQPPTLENRASAESAVASDSVPESPDAEAAVVTAVAAEVGADGTAEHTLPAEEVRATEGESGSASSGGKPPMRASTPEDARLYAMMGLTLDGETEVVFESRRDVPFAGSLLAVPALAATGLFDAVRAVFRQLRSAVYGLRATVLVLSLLALLRRPRPEHLKGTDPQAFGDVLGLLRSPEVKTLRRKLAEIAKIGKAHIFAQTLARRWIKEHEDALGVLYIDGHVRVYHGKHKLPKGHVTQLNRCKPATSEYWVNDVTGDPVLVVTAPANAGLTKMLPKLLDEIEALCPGRGGTLVFDRGGWSPDLFAKILARETKWHILTYRKGKIRKHLRSGFTVQSMQIDGHEVQYTLSERTVHLKNGQKMREIAELRDDGGQTILLTSHFGQPAVLLAYRLFERWRQENYFKYMKENFALDALVDYAVEPDDPLREVPNPARKAIDKKLDKAKAEVARLERLYGEAVENNKESSRRTVRGFKIANGKIGKALRAARLQVAKLAESRKKTPERVTVGEVRGEDKVVKLSVERKLFTNVIKAAAYRAESFLLGLLRPHFRRAEDEGRAFLRTVVQQRGDLIVKGDLVTVRLAPLSAPRFTAALRELCVEVNKLAPRFPETTYRLRFEVAGEC